jgi:hypothetical protein
MNAVLRQLLGGKTKPPKLSKKGVTTRAGHNRLVDRESLDGRLAITKAYDRLVAEIHVNLGGAAQLTAMELELVEAFAAASIVAKSINMQILTGAQIEPALVSMLAQSINAMSKTGSRLGTARRTKSVPTMNEWLAQQARADGKTPDVEIVE